ncbi:MAG: S1 RNA-binding domain-containing protein [Anaerolineaceae bacterium]|nr:S1 RNA-binding domain-containing protein [Anaerolineaceae bacterium]
MGSELVTGISSSSELKRRMHLKGKILKTNKAGAIVDIGVEKPALLHVSQIIVKNNEPILRVEDSLKEGQEVDVYIRNIRDDRIEVTMKAPLALEWREITKNMIVKGKVTKIEKFGAFIDIGTERPGLVHISELTQGYIHDASEVVSVGDEVEAKVIEFNRRKKQIKLSMKAMQPALDEIEGVTITSARRNRHSKKTKSKKEKQAATAEQPVENEPTVMETALREAMEKANDSKPNTESRPKKGNHISETQAEILSRTLNQRS